MEVLLDTCGVIDTLHQKGFTDYFVFHGNDILWVQKQMFLNADKFTFVEYHRFADVKGEEAIVFAVIELYHGIMGILIKHCNDYIGNCRTMIENKIDALLPFGNEKGYGYFNGLTKSE